MSEYLYEGKTIYPPQLETELRALSFGSTKYRGFAAMGGAASRDITVHTTDELTVAEKDELDDAIDNHNPVDEAVDAAIGKAVAFGRDLVLRWNKIMLKEGIVQAGQSYNVSKQLIDFTVMTNNGYLYAADAELANLIPVNQFLDADRIKKIRNEIRAYLGLPLLT